MADDGEPFKLRSYQDEMLEESLKQNSIIVLDTGSGKTHIAIARIRAELESCSTDKLVWFLAPTVALCRQHATTFETFLAEFQIRVLSGEDGVELWTESMIWDAVLKNIRVVISTYAVLDDALAHGFVNISKLALCVFDEAHHCTKNHPSNSIMQKFYLPARRSGMVVPHILGLTASPAVNAKAGGLEVLESNLDSRAITPKLMRQELMEYVHVPELLKFSYRQPALEEVGGQSALYTAMSHKLQTYNLESDPFVLKLRSVGDTAALSQIQKIYLGRSTYCTDQLKGLRSRMGVILHNIGPSAADWYLRACYQQMAKGLENSGLQWMPELSESEKRHLTRTVEQIVSHDCEYSNMAHSLAPKTQLLLDILSAESNSSFTGLIFAEQRAVVATLAEIVSRHPLTAGLFNVGTFVGISNSSKRKGDVCDIVKLNEQQQNLDEFRVGKKNLIIATSVLEEGIDISSCQTVICFDSPKNLVSFVQRRGRARKRGSKYIVLLADDDSKGDPGKWHKVEEMMKTAYMSDLRNVQMVTELESQREHNSRQYLVPTTGALLTTQNAKAHLSHFCATLLTNGYSELKPIFSCQSSPIDRLLTATVTLPRAVHPSVRRANSSRSFSTERAAMSDAAFEAYVALHKEGLINDNLLPLRTKINDLASEIPSRPSSIKVSPRLNPWALSSQEPRKWSQYRVQVEIGSDVDTALLMYLPVECPQISDMALFWSASTTGVARISRDQAMLADQSEISEQSVNDTLKLLALVFPPGRIMTERRDLVALFRPIGYEASVSQDTLQAANVINQPGFGIKDCGLLRLKGEIGRAFVFQHTIQGLAETDQRLVQARKFPKKRDLTRQHDIAASLKDSAAIELPLDECLVDVLPARYSFAAACIPSILHHIENTLLAQELQRTLLKPIGMTDSDLVIEATTSSSANSVRNYERLEYLGDAVLKFCTHVQLMAQHPTWPESFLTADKGRTNGNASLATAALKTGVDRFITVRGFTAHGWQPPCFSNAIDDMEEKVERSTKTLADVVEALIGASFHAKGLVGALDSIRIFLPDEPWYPLDRVNDTLRDLVPANTHQNTALLEELIGYKFVNQTLLIEATTHASYTSSESTLSYERLEFLGDAVLDQIIVPELFRHQPPLKNHQMHRLRQSLANGHFLGFLCMEMSTKQERVDVVKNPDTMSELNGFELEQSSHTFGLLNFLRCGHSLGVDRKLALARYSELCDGIRHGLQHGQEYPWSALFELHPPKWASDMIESLLGAIYIDSHGSLDACGSFLDRCGLLSLMRRFLDEDVNVAYPKERLGVLADKEKVFYDTKKVFYDTKIVVPATDDDNVDSDSDGNGGGGSYESTVMVGDRIVATVKGCAHHDEAEVKAASKAVAIIELEKGNQAAPAQTPWLWELWKLESTIR